MPLPPTRIQRGRETPYRWEREALDFVEVGVPGGDAAASGLPNADPHQVWELQELHDPTTGRLYEIDLLVLARTGLYLVEIKSHPGILRGDLVDWVFMDGRVPRHVECPYSLTNHKAKVLGTLLDRQMPNGRPFVQPLVFVSAPGINVQLDVPRPEWLVDRKTIRDTLVKGIGAAARARPVDARTMHEVGQALRAIGLRASAQSRLVAGFQLKTLVDEGPGYQEHIGVNTRVTTDTARVRIYLVPRQTTSEARELLSRAAQREADVLAQIGRHPSILSYRHFEPNASPGPAVLFEAFPDSLPLHVFLRAEPDLSFDDRLSILQQIVEAVAHIHKQGFLHRNLSPASVLARRNAAGRPEIRLHRFQAASHTDRSSIGTRHVHQLAEELDRLYQAPEVLQDPSTATETADLFSIGCLAWLLLTSQAPAPTLAERERILKGPGLVPSAFRSDLAPFDRAIAVATDYHPVNRAAEALVWFEDDLLNELTRPEPAPDPDPYEARADDVVGGYTVERTVGSGATARVLLVRKGDAQYALKVPHNEGCTTRIEGEFRALKAIRHSRIVEAVELLTLGGRKCLLMEYAGPKSLEDELREVGTLGLDVAPRYGEDLLSAVQYLEERGFTHRDIKPGNLGFSNASKKAKHLVLFDFSLTEADPAAVSAGTPEWRDPWLHERGTWDSAADRYAAAAVLYRMLTGVRPVVAPDGPDRGTVRVEAERFDAAVRDRLYPFFVRALDREVAARFPSAEEMKNVWVGIFAAATAAAVPTEVDDKALASARPGTPVEALPLSPRARNALDRAGVSTVADLLQLPRNHLSALRGVGRAVVEEIARFAAQLRERLHVSAAPPLLANYPGPRLTIEPGTMGLDAASVTALIDAGLGTTHDLAATPRDRIDRLLPGASDSLLAGLQHLAADRGAMGTLDQWVEALLAPAGKSKTEAERRIRALLGLDPLPRGHADLAALGARSVGQIAEAMACEQPLIHSSLQVLRDRWRASPVLPDLRAAVADALGGLGLVAPMSEVASALASARVAGGVPNEHDLRKATALVRLAAELRPDAPIEWIRGGRGVPWVGEDHLALEALARLGKAADLLAATDVLASTETVRSTLSNLAAGTPLASVPTERLTALAVEFSETAAASARLEIYPRGMAAERAIALSSPVLAGEMGIDQLRQRVAARYPEAAPLPDRPALDALVLPVGLVWVEQSQRYARPGAPAMTSAATVHRPSYYPTARHDQAPRHSPEALEAQEFQEALERGVESGRFRVVRVEADFGDQAAVRIGSVLGVEPDSLDARLWAAVLATAAATRVRADVMLQADRDGPGGPHWDRLTKLMRRAADQVVDALCAERDRPRLLVHPGAFARYGLAAPLERLAQRAESEEGAAIILLLAAHNDGQAPSINGVLPIHAPLPGQRLRLPYAWLQNAHRAAAP
jgi:serine/threonine protein kinase